MKITAIKQQVKRADRYSVYVDGKYSFSLSEGALLEQRLASGLELEPMQLEELKAASSNDKAYGNALRWAAMRPRSGWELVMYLRRKDVEEPVAEMITEKLQRIGLLDDLGFARSWVSSRRLLKATSVRKLRLELKQKHVAESLIDQVLAEDETTDTDSLQALVAKKRARYPDQQKFMQYLARQGFGYEDIKRALAGNSDADDYYNS